MKRTSLIVAAIVLTSSVAFGQTMKMEEVPVAVRAAAIAASQGGKIDSVQIEFERGVAIYEFKVTLPDNKKLEIDVDHHGKIEEVEEVIQAADVPQVVTQTLNRVMPNFRPTLIERSLRHNFEVFYEFEGKDQRGAEVDIEVRADGKIILIADDEAN